MALILVLDDHDLLTRAIRDILEVEGYPAIACSDSFEAWALLQALPFDLLIQDCDRPDVGGGTFYRHLRADPALSSCLVMMLSASGPDTACVHKSDVAAYVQKPFDPEELIATVEMVLSHQDGLADVDAPRMAQIEHFLTSPTVVDRQIMMLDDPSPDVRLLAARYLGLRGTKEAVEPLLAALEDPVEHVRGAAALALGRLNARESALAPLIAALGDPSYLVRMMAARALAHLDDQRAVRPLLACFEDDNFWVRVSAAQSAGRIKENDPLLFTVA